MAKRQDRDKDRAFYQAAGQDGGTMQGLDPMQSAQPLDLMQGQTMQQPDPMQGQQMQGVDPAQFGGGLSPQMGGEDVPTVMAVGEQQVRKFNEVLQKYKAGKHNLENRIISAENWWKMRNQLEEEKKNGQRYQGHRSKSGWLHNVIVSKHADAMEAYPSPTILPREQGDAGEAQILTSIVPYVLEQNDFEQTYSDANWRKLKGGTAVYKITWDQSKLGGLGDINIESVSLLNIYWEPGVTDIQKSRYFFHAELMDDELLKMQYPQLAGKNLAGGAFQPSKFLYDDTVSTSGKSAVIDVYYHIQQGGQSVLHYCKYVGETVLYATENDPTMSRTGLYDHGLYPYVFDALFPVEGSPCGYGFVDLCAPVQEEIDHMRTAMLQNTLANAKPRYFVRQDGSINEDEFCNMESPMVHVDGNLGEDSIRPITGAGLSSNYVDYLSSTISELREISGNTEASTGSSTSGVTAASAIAALQEASGKGSRDSSKSAYRAYSRMVSLVIELIRQFYDAPRSYRITGKYGNEQYVSYSNQGLQPQMQVGAMGEPAGYRRPVFDIKVSAQKQSQYTTISQNELMLQLFQLGMFNPQAVDQALMCLEGMQFEGKEELCGRIAQQGTMQQQLITWQQMALALAQRYEPGMVDGLAQSAMQGVNGGAAVKASSQPVNLSDSKEASNVSTGAQTLVDNARQKSQEASQPTENRAVAKRD